MIRHRDGGTRRSGAPGLPSSVPELARTLRRVRTRQGLRLEDVSARTGVPLSQLEALESGTVDRIPDQVAIVKALRTYASSLGLSGDQFALSLVEHWPVTHGVHTPTAAVNGTGVVPAGGHPTAMVPSVGSTDTSGWVGNPVAAPNPFTTGPIPVATPWPATTGQSPAIAVPLPAGTAAGQGTFQPGIADTGITPTVSGAAHRPRRPRTRAPLWLRLLVGLVGLAVLVGLAGLIIQEVEPSWLDSLGLTHPSHPDHQTSGQTGTAGGGGSSPTSRSTSTTAAGGSGRNAFHLVSTTPTTATFDVASPNTQVEVIAVTDPSWVQISETGQAAPLFSGILEAGQSKSFPVQHSLTVQVGSSAAHVYVSADGKNLGFYFPPAAPYTMTFQAGP